MLDIRATHYVSPLSEIEFASVHLTVHIVNIADETGLVTGTFRVYNDTTGLLIHTSDIIPFYMPSGQSIDVSALTDFDPPAPADDQYFVIFDGNASNALVPRGIAFKLGSFYFDVKPVGMGPAPAAHHVTHEDTGSDEVDVTGLSGLLADAQTPLGHAADHQLAGSDEIDVTGLSGLLAAEQTPLPHYHDKHLGIFQSFDFFYSAAGAYPLGWFAERLSAGIIASLAGTANHPGITRLLSSVTPNSGVAIRTNNDSLLISGTEKTDVIIRPQILAGTTIRLGFIDTSTSADCVDGVYIEMAQVGGIDGVIVGKTAAAAARSTTATSFTLITNTWYRLRIRLNAAATLATFTLFSEAGAVLWTDTLNINIPTAAGQETGHGIIATNSGAAAVIVGDVDYMDLAIDRTLVR